MWAPSQTIFSVLYTIGTEKYDNLLRFAAARLILDYLQLFLVLMRPAHGEQEVPRSTSCCAVSQRPSLCALGCAPRPCTRLCTSVLLTRALLTGARPPPFCPTGFVFNSDLWVWHAIKWIEFANPLTSDVSVAGRSMATQPACPSSPPPLTHCTHICTNAEL